MLKRARDDRGKRATQREAALSGSHEMLNPVLAHADDFSWARAPKLRPAENTELSQALGYSGDPESEWFKNMMVDARRGKQPEYWSPQQREFTDNVMGLLKKHPQIDDIDHPGQWGFDGQNKLRLLDYGEELTPEARAMFAEDYPYMKPSPPAGQLELPAVPPPEYNYHATPQSNAQKIAELGLRPEEGGKNFAFKKNQGRVYMSPEKDAEMWASKLKDLSGEEPLQIRTTAPAQTVPGANDAVRIRTDAVQPERLQYKTAAGWEPLKRLLEKKVSGPLPPNMSEHQLKLLAAALGVKFGLDQATN